MTKNRSGGMSGHAPTSGVLIRHPMASRDEITRERIAALRKGKVTVATVVPNAGADETIHDAIDATGEETPPIIEEGRRMPGMRVILDGDGALRALIRKAYKDCDVPFNLPAVAPPGGGLIALSAEAVITIPPESDIIVSCLDRGTKEGRPTIALGFQLPDGRAVWAQTTVRLFLQAADAMRAKYGDVHTADGEGLGWEAEISASSPILADVVDSLDVMRRTHRPPEPQAIDPEGIEAVDVSHRARTPTVGDLQPILDHAKVRKVDLFTGKTEFEI